MFRILACCLFILASSAAVAAEAPGNISFTVDTPPGWLRDDKAGIKQGVDAAFYPKTSTWVDAPAVIYARKIEKVGGSVQKTIDADVAGFTEVMPDLIVSDEQGFFTRDGKLAFVKKLEDAKTGNTEVLAYIGEKDSVSILALDTKTKQAAVKSLPALRALVNSYSMGDGTTSVAQTEPPAAPEEPQVKPEEKIAEPELKAEAPIIDKQEKETTEVSKPIIEEAKDICPPVKLDQRNLTIAALDYDFKLDAPKGWAFEVIDGQSTFYQPSSSCAKNLGVIKVASRYGLEDSVAAIIASAATHFGYDLSKMTAGYDSGGLTVKTRDNKTAVIQRYKDERSGDEIALAYIRTPNPVPKNDTYTVLLLSSGSKQVLSTLTPSLETLVASYRQKFKAPR